MGAEDTADQNGVHALGPPIVLGGGGKEAQRRMGSLYSGTQK